MTHRLLLATVAPLALATIASAKPSSKHWTLALHPMIALWRPGGVEVSARLAPLKGLVACPSVRVEWGDGSASERASDCDEGAPAETVEARHVYGGSGEFVVSVTVEESGRQIRLDRALEIIE